MFAEPIQSRTLKVVMVFGLGHRSTELARPTESPVVVKTLPIEPDGAHLREIGIKRSGGLLHVRLCMSVHAARYLVAGLSIGLRPRQRVNALRASACLGRTLPAEPVEVQEAANNARFQRS